MRRRIAIYILISITLGVSACTKPAPAPTKPKLEPPPSLPADTFKWDNFAPRPKPEPLAILDVPQAYEQAGRIPPARSSTFAIAPQPATRPSLLPDQTRTLPPVIGDWWTWLQAEVECERLVTTIGGDSIIFPWQEFDRLREMAERSPSAAILWAMLLRDHTSVTLRVSVLNGIGRSRAPWMRTPEIRQLVWASKDADIPYASIDPVLTTFGPDQLRPLADADFLQQLEAVVNGNATAASDEMLEMYFREAVRRKLPGTATILEKEDKYRAPHRTLMIRNARNRCLGLPDAITFKVTRHPDDPKLLMIELALTDPEFTQYDLTWYYSAPPHVDVSVNGNLWMEKWPASQVLNAGKPWRTAVSTAIVRQPHKVRVSLRLWNSDRIRPPESLLLPGPRMLDWVAEFDMPGEK